MKAEKLSLRVMKSLTNAPDAPFCDSRFNEAFDSLDFWTPRRTPSKIFENHFFILLGMID